MPSYGAELGEVFVSDLQRGMEMDRRNHDDLEMANSFVKFFVPVSEETKV